MNEQTIKHNHELYHVPGCSDLMRLKKNTISISEHCTFRHELAKCVAAIMLRKFGDVKFNDRMIELLHNMEAEMKILTVGWSCSKTDFITEAVPNELPGRRVDLVSLNTDTRYEFETSKSVRKDNCCTIYI